MASEENMQDDVVAIELPAPAGWIKKFTPKKGGTPQRNDIVFLSPTGEEIKNKRQLDQYLKSHPGGPAVSEFDWGTGDTPRRSARLSEKSKATEAPTSQSPKKKRKTSGTKGSQEKSDADAQDEAADEKDAAAEETKESAEVSVVDAKGAGDGEVISDKALQEKANIEDVEKKTETEVVSEEPSLLEPHNDANTENVNAEEPNGAPTVVADAKIDESKQASSEEPGAKIDESEEAYSEVPGGKIDESKDACSEIPGAKIDESKEACSEVQCAKNDEYKDACHAEKEIPDGKVDTADAVVVDQTNSKENQAAEEPVEQDPVLQEPKTGS